MKQRDGWALVGRDARLWWGLARYFVGSPGQVQKQQPGGRRSNGGSPDDGIFITLDGGRQFGAQAGGRWTFKKAAL